LNEYLEHRGLPALPYALAGTYLIGGLPAQLKRGNKQAGDGVKSQTVHLALKELFATMARKSFKDPKAGIQLGRATTHWLRHTAATRAVAANVPLDVVASTLGHASLTTTSRYVRAEQHRKIAEMQKLWSGPVGQV
jgi:integrase